MHYYNTDNLRINRADLTSRLQKCLEIKERYPDAIVLFEYENPPDNDDDYDNVDVFYESYSLDATKASLSANIGLTYKLATTSGDTEEFMNLIRFPDYSLKQVSRKLIENGHKVVVVDWRSGRGKSKELRPWFRFPNLDLVMSETET